MVPIVTMQGNSGSDRLMGKSSTLLWNSSFSQPRKSNPERTYQHGVDFDARPGERPGGPAFAGSRARWTHGTDGRFGGSRNPAAQRGNRLRRRGRSGLHVPASQARERTARPSGGAGQPASGKCPMAGSAGPRRGGLLWRTVRAGAGAVADRFGAAAGGCGGIGKAFDRKKGPWFLLESGAYQFGGATILTDSGYLRPG